MRLAEENGESAASRQHVAVMVDEVVGLVRALNPLTMVAKFAQRRTGDRVAQLFETFYVGGAHEVQVDRQGRILIPPKLREFAGLGRDVTFSAKHNRFQLWDRATLERILRSAEEQLVADPELLAKLDF